MSGSFTLARFRYAALVAGVVLVAAGLVGFWLAARSETPLAQNIWSNIGAVLATAGLVGVIYDSLLKPRLLSDIKSSLDLDASGVVAVGPLEELPIARWAPRHKDIVVIVPDVLEWLKRGDWRFLYALAQRTEIDLRVYGHISPHDEGSVDQSVMEGWSTSGSAGQSAAQRGSSVVVFGRADRTQVALYRSGDVAILGVDAPFAPFLWGAAVGMQLQRSSSELWEWVLGAEARVARDSRQVCRFPNAPNSWI